jgi:hypothetical protein
MSGGYDRGSDFPGRIDISITATEKDGKLGDIVLSVSDDGVGMTPDILTGDLLEFGHSFWGSEKASRIYPGLLSSPDFEPTGRFGIGFFAIFMMADDVKVISRPYQAGVRDSKTLHFHSGLKSRAEFRNYDAQEDGVLPRDCCTLVSAIVKHQRWLEAFASMSMWDEERNASRQRQETQAFSWELVKRTLSQLVFALDVEVWLCEQDGKSTRINRPGILKVPVNEFAESFNALMAMERPTLREPRRFEPDDFGLIDSISSAVGRVHSRGRIDDTESSGWCHIGGLTVFKQRDPQIQGVIEIMPGTVARRGGTRVASQTHLLKFCVEQSTRIESLEISGSRLFVAICNLASFGVDISSQAVAEINFEIQNITKAISKLDGNVEIFVPARRFWSQSGRYELAGGLDNPYLSTNNIVQRKYNWIFGCSGSVGRSLYTAIVGPLDVPENPNSAYGVLINTLKAQGFQLEIEPPDQVVIGIYDGPEGGVGGRIKDLSLIPGSEIKRTGIVIHAVAK